MLRVVVALVIGVALGALAHALATDDIVVDTKAPPVRSRERDEVPRAFSGTPVVTPAAKPAPSSPPDAVRELEEKLRWAGGVPLDPPDNLEGRFTQFEFEPAVRAAFTELGLELVALDCAEHPCMAYGKKPKPFGQRPNLNEMNAQLRHSTAFAAYKDDEASTWSVYTPTDVIVGIGFQKRPQGPEVDPASSMGDSEDAFAKWRGEMDLRSRRQTMRQVEALESLR